MSILSFFSSRIGNLILIVSEIKKPALSINRSDSKTNFIISYL